MAQRTTTDLFNVTDCWLSPKGVVVVGDDEYNGHAFHEELALCIMRDLLKFESKSDAFDYLHENFWNKYAYDWLEDQGWVRLHSMRNIERARWILYVDQKLTFQQKQKIRQWCRVNNKVWEKVIDRA